MTKLEDLQGVWSRSFIRQPDGTYDDTTKVTWMQAPTLYADLRQPLTDVSFAGVMSLRDLDWRQVNALARQEGFAGVLVQHQDHFEWTRSVDFQPPQVVGDRGVLNIVGDSMIEEGYELQYVEHWHRDAIVNGPAAALHLRDVENGTSSVVVRVANRFIFARGRLSTLDRTGRLADHVRAAPSLASARDLIDCEVSTGAADAGWCIEASTLPYRVKARLSPRFTGKYWQTFDIAPDAQETTRTWEIVSEEGDQHLLASGPL